MVPTVTGHGNRAIVLLSSRHMVGHVTCGHDVVQLGGDVILLGPCFSTIDTNDSPTIIGGYHPFWIIGVYPQIMIVPMRDFNFGVKGFTTVRRFPEIHIKSVDGLLI